MEVQRTNRLNWDKFAKQFHESWHKKMKPIIESEQVGEIYSFLKKSGKEITPHYSNTFRSFRVDLSQLNVVMVGQDPYPQKSGELYVANGRAFDCSNTGVLQKSLEILYSGIEDDCYGGLNLEYTPTPDLSYLEMQNVMLTNASLTCFVNNPGSHYELWKPFWALVFEEIFSVQAGLIFIFMGRNAQFYENYTNTHSHNVLECEHPIAASYSGRSWKHERVFSEANQILKENNGIEISWLLQEAPF